MRTRAFVALILLSSALAGCGGADDEMARLLADEAAMEQRLEELSSDPEALYEFLAQVEAYQTRAISRAAEDRGTARAFESYARALASRDLDGFWEHSSAYHGELEAALADLPKNMWEDRTRQLKSEWTQRILDARSNTAPGTQSWYLVREGTDVDVIEVRAGEGRIKAFATISIPSEEASPVYLVQDGDGVACRKNVWGVCTRRLKAATLALTGAPAADRFLVDPAAEVVEGTVEVWPIPAPDPTRLEELVRQVQGGVDPRPPMATINGHAGFTVTHPFTGAARPDEADAMERFRAVVAAYGIGELAEDQYNKGTYYLFVQPPESWSDYQTGMPLSFWLASSVHVEMVEDPTMRSEDIATARFRIAYSSCTPICHLIRDLAGVGLTDRLFARYQPDQLTGAYEATASFEWTLERGWQSQNRPSIVEGSWVPWSRVLEDEAM